MKDKICSNGITNFKGSKYPLIYSKSTRLLDNFDLLQTAAVHSTSMAIALSPKLLKHSATHFQMTSDFLCQLLPSDQHSKLTLTWCVCASVVRVSVLCVSASVCVLCVCAHVVCVCVIVCVCMMSRLCMLDSMHPWHFWSVLAVNVVIYCKTPCALVRKGILQRYVIIITYNCVKSNRAPLALVFGTHIYHGRQWVLHVNKMRNLCQEHDQRTALNGILIV